MAEKPCPLQSLRAAGRMEDHAAEIPRGDADVAEAGLRHQRGKLRWRRELRHGAGEICVRLLVAGDRAADAGKNLPTVEAEDARHRARAGLRKFEDAEFSAPAQNAGKLAETLLVIRQVAKAECGGDEVE